MAKEVHKFQAELYSASYIHRLLTLSCIVELFPTRNLPAFSAPVGSFFFAGGGGGLRGYLGIFLAAIPTPVFSLEVDQIT